MKKINTATIAALALLAGAAQADLYEISINGTVDFGTLNFGAFQGMQSGNPASMSFMVDSNTYVDGDPSPIGDPVIARRGYEIIASSFELTVNDDTVGMPASAPNTPYFVIRNDDPAVDGFYLSSVPGLGLDNGVTIDYPAALGPNFNALFSATYGGDRLDSLDIAGATGTYDFTGLTVFNWGMDDSGIQPVGFIFDSFTITLVPAPSAMALLAVAPLAGMRRRR